jgi:uncharacterized membrane protein YeiH
VRYVLEHFAVAVCAITGVLAAKGKSIDLFGVVVLALVTALGGGTIRDLCLGISPVFWITDPNYLLTAVAAALATFAVARFRELPQMVLLVADAFGLALFTMVGVEKSVSAGVANTIALFLGVMTGVGGGVIRDVLCGEIPLVFRREIHIYATAAFCGAGLFLLLHHFFPNWAFNRLVTVAAILLLRLAGIRWKLGLPLFAPRNE